MQQAPTELWDEAFRVARLTANTPELRSQAWSNVTAWSQTYTPWIARLMPTMEPLHTGLTSRIAVSLVITAALDWSTSSGDKPAAITALQSVLAVARGISGG